MKRWLPAHKAPLALAGFLSLPLFFAALMATSLAIEKPHVLEWRSRGKLLRTFHDPVGSLEAKIWLLSIVVAAALVAVGWFASFLRYGIYVVCVAAVAEALALTIRLGTWERHHTARFPYGEDNLSDKTNSSLVDRGQWEHEAAHTVHSLVGYTVGLAVVSAAIAVVLELRRRRGPLPVPPPPPPGTSGVPSTTLPVLDAHVQGVAGELE